MPTRNEQPPITRESPKPAETEVVEVMYVSVEQLIADNPPSSVYNPSIHDAIVANFNPSEFDTVKCVRVSIGNKVKLLIKDGMNRAHAVDTLRRAGGKHASVGSVGHHIPSQDFSQIPIVDVTESQFPSNDLDLEQHDETGEPVLTLEQYWKIIVEPTVKQHEIAHERVTAIIAAGWNELLGTELSTRFSYLSLLQVLEKAAKHQIRFSSDQELFRLVERHYFSEELNEEDHSTLVHATYSVIELMRKVIGEEQVSFRKAIDIAFRKLIAEASDKDTQSSAVQQLTALLSNTIIEKKIRDEFGNNPLTIQATRERIAHQIAQKISVLEDEKSSKLVRELLLEFERPLLTLSDIERILEQEDPLTEAEHTLANKKWAMVIAELQKKNISSTGREARLLSNLSVVDDKGSLKREVVNQMNNVVRKFNEMVSQLTDLEQEQRQRLREGFSPILDFDEIREIFETRFSDMCDETNVYHKEKGIIDLQNYFAKHILVFWDAKVLEQDTSAVLANIEWIKDPAQLPDKITQNHFSLYIYKMLKSGDYTIPEIKQACERCQQLAERPDLLSLVLSRRTSLSRALDIMQAAKAREALAVPQPLAPFPSQVETPQAASSTAVEQQVFPDPPKPQHTTKTPVVQESVEVLQTPQHVAEFNSPLTQSILSLGRELDTHGSFDQLGISEQMLLRDLLNRIGELLTSTRGLDVERILIEHLQQVAGKKAELITKVVADTKAVDFRDKN